MNTSKPTERKPYAAPTLVRHGDAVERTRGVNGAFYEYSGWRWGWEGPFPEDSSPKPSIVKD